MQVKNKSYVSIELIPVGSSDYEFLYEMLKEREPYQSISFEMPTWEDHVKFLESNHYTYFYIIVEDGKKVGNIYLTKLNEWGYFILNSEQGKGLGTKAILKLTKLHPRKFYLANVNPDNERAIHLAHEKLGGELVQYTYRIDNEYLIKKFS